MTPYSHHIRAEFSGEEGIGARINALIGRGIERLRLQRKTAEAQRKEFSAMCQNAQRPPVECKTGRYGPERRLSDTQRLEMKQLRRAGMSVAAIAERFACSHTTVFRITGKAKGPLL